MGYLIIKKFTYSYDMTILYQIFTIFFSNTKVIGRDTMYANTLYNALNPMFFVSFLFGTSPIYSKFENERHILKSSNIFKLITIAYLSVYTCTLMYGFGNSDNKMSVTYFGNAISSIGLVLDGIGQILLLYTIYILSFVTPKNIKNIIENLSIIDSIFMDFGHTTNYRKIFWQQILLITTGISAIILTIAFQFFVVSNQSLIQMSETMWFVYYFPLFVIFVMECQFAIMIYLICERFKMLNAILVEMSHNNEPQVKLVQKIQTTMEVHDSLVDIAGDVNSNYSFQIMICLAVLFIKTVFAVFFAYFEQFVLGKLTSALNWGMWSMIDWSAILLITVVCHLAASHAKDTGIAIHKLLMNIRDDEIREKLLVFSQQIFHRPVEFSACGLFNIDAQLLFAIIGSGTIYLLIMMQFQEGTEETNCIIASNNTT